MLGIKEVSSLKESELLSLGERQWEEGVEPSPKRGNHLRDLATRESEEDMGTKGRWVIALPKVNLTTIY